MASALEALNDPSLVFVVENVLSPQECARQMARMDAEDLHPIHSGTPAGAVRQNSRFIQYDAALASHLYGAVRAHVPHRLVGMEPCGGNECIRFYRYAPGDFFKPHQDTDFQRSPVERSLLSVVVYLNSGFEGGDLVLHASGRVIKPRAGLAAVFGHRVVHESTRMVSGVKYALRSDVMYRKLPQG